MIVQLKMAAPSHELLVLTQGRRVQSLLFELLNLALLLFCTS